MRRFIIAALLALPLTAQPAFAQRLAFEPREAQSGLFDWEHATYLVTLMYQGALFREPEPQGLNNWARMIVRDGYQGLLNAAYGIGGSTEFRTIVQRRYRTDEIIDNLYWVLLGRDPDWSGRNHWGAMLRQGRGGDTLRGIVGSQEFYQIHIR